MKKKVVSLMLVLAMTVSMTACGNKNNAADDANAVEDRLIMKKYLQSCMTKNSVIFGQLTRKLMKLKPFLRNLHLKQSQKQS